MLVLHSVLVGLSTSSDCFRLCFRLRFFFFFFFFFFVTDLFTSPVESECTQLGVVGVLAGLVGVATLLALVYSESDSESERMSEMSKRLLGGSGVLATLLVLVCSESDSESERMSEMSKLFLRGSYVITKYRAEQ